jgi:MYXO-CTERM domain-containing protein
MKRFYVSHWFLLATAALVMALAGYLNGSAMVAFGLIALALAGRRRRRSPALEC